MSLIKSSVALASLLVLAEPVSSQEAATPNWFGFFEPGSASPTILEWSALTGAARRKVGPDAANAVALPAADAAWYDTVAFRRSDVLAAGAEHRLVAAIHQDASPYLVLSELRRTRGTWSRVAGTTALRLRQLDRRPTLLDREVQNFQSAAILSWDEQSRSLHLLVADEYANADPFKKDEPPFLDRGVYETHLTIPTTPEQAGEARFVDGAHRPKPDGDCKLVAIGGEMRVFSAADRTWFATRLDQAPKLVLGVPQRGTGLLRLHERAADGRWKLVPTPPIWVCDQYSVSRGPHGEFQLVQVEARASDRWRITEASLAADGVREEWDVREREVVVRDGDPKRLFWQQRPDGPCPWVITAQGMASALR